MEERDRDRGKEKEKQKRKEKDYWGWGCSSVVDHLFSIDKALGFTLSTVNKAKLSTFYEFLKMLNIS